MGAAILWCTSMEASLAKCTALHAQPTHTLVQGCGLVPLQSFRNVEMPAALLAGQLSASAARLLASPTAAAAQTAGKKCAESALKHLRVMFPHAPHGLGSPGSLLQLLGGSCRAQHAYTDDSPCTPWLGCPCLASAASGWVLQGQWAYYCGLGQSMVVVRAGQGGLDAQGWLWPWRTRVGGGS